MPFSEAMRLAIGEALTRAPGSEEAGLGEEAAGSAAAAAPGVAGRGRRLAVWWRGPAQSAPAF